MVEKKTCPFKFKYKPKSLGQRLKRGCGLRLKINNIRRGARSDSKHSSNQQPNALVDLKQLNESGSFDLVVMDIAERYRLSSYTIFKKNLFDPISLILIIFIYSFSYLLTLNSSMSSFIILFVSMYYPINYHLESYRSFIAVSKNLNLFKQDAQLRSIFLSSLVYKCQLLEYVKSVDPNLMNPSNFDNWNSEKKKDTFRWVNELIRFFWPYLSHLIHCELDEFFHAQIESGKLVNSDIGAKKFCGALIKQLTSNILEIKKCQFGSQSPVVKDFTVGKSHNPDLANKVSEEKNNSQDQFLTYDLYLQYNGNMIIKVIYRYFYCCSSKLGLEDVYLHFKIRFILGPIKQELPFVESISFSLMDLPEYGYKGIALVELAELRVIRGIIDRVIEDNILDPKIVSIPLKAVMRALMEGPKKKEDDKIVRDRESPCFMKLLVNSFLCGCMCLNVLLKSCHDKKGNQSKNKIIEASVEDRVDPVT